MNRPIAPAYGRWERGGLFEVTSFVTAVARDINGLMLGPDIAMGYPLSIMVGRTANVVPYKLVQTSVRFVSRLNSALLRYPQTAPANVLQTIEIDAESHGLDMTRYQ